MLIPLKIEWVNGVEQLEKNEYKNKNKNQNNIHTHASSQLFIHFKMILIWATAYYCFSIHVSFFFVRFIFEYRASIL